MVSAIVAVTKCHGSSRPSDTFTFLTKQEQVLIYPVSGFLGWIGDNTADGLVSGFCLRVTIFFAEGV